MWFKELMGFDEISPETVRKYIFADGMNLISKMNEKSYQFGRLEVPTLQELRSQSPNLEKYQGKISISEIVGDVQKMHCNPENKNALFQAASQFNLLEMIGPDVRPERGVDIYERDKTQGPACAIACGAGTIYRNYFAPVNGQIGQSAYNQIDCLDLIGEALGNENNHLWQMRNGYALPRHQGLGTIDEKLKQLTDKEREELKEKLKIGLQWETEVTLASNQQIVSQAYCSALPVAYSSHQKAQWERFAKLILEGTYEATFHAGLQNYVQTGSNKVFLTLVGGGAFGNDLDWIMDALQHSIEKFQYTPLDIRIVSYNRSNDRVRQLINEWN